MPSKAAYKTDPIWLIPKDNMNNLDAAIEMTDFGE